MIDLIKRPHLTDKSLTLIERNKYVFEVSTKLTKTEIKNLVEQVFSVKVKKVNTHIPPKGKKRRQKRAIVSLQKGNSIDIFSNTLT